MHDIVEEDEDFASSSEVYRLESSRSHASQSPGGRPFLKSQREHGIRGSHQSLKPSAPAHQQARAPKARHPTDRINPHYLETEAYCRGPAGVVYDWRTHHEQNAGLGQIQKQQQRVRQVQAALEKELEVKRRNEANWRIWLAMKEEEKDIQLHYVRQTIAACSLPPVTQMPPEERVVREAGWNKSTVTFPSAGGLNLGRSKLIKTPGKISNWEKL